jgi:GDPmannose 4,6-dehydratase
MKIALITGVNGQDGSYLAEFLLRKNYIVHGMIRRSSSINTWRIDDIIKSNYDFHLHYGDMTDSSSLDSLIISIQPDEIYNLAAMSHVKISFEIPEYTANVDALGTLRLLESIKKSGRNIRFYQAGTSEMYGKTDYIPQNENTPFNPRSPYAVSKVFAHYTTIDYREAYNIFACNGILFNHSSPKRGYNFVEKKIVDSAINIKNGKQECLYLGNLYAKRDIGHAKDYVIAMWLMLQQDVADDYVIATGTTLSIKEIVEIVFKKLDMSITWQNSGLNEVGLVDGCIRVAIDIKFFRPNEVDILLGDYSKAFNKLGWTPTYSIDDIIDEIIKYN